MQSQDWAIYASRVLSEISSFLARATTHEERLAMSVGLVVGTVLVGRFVLPFVVGLLDRFVDERFVTGRIADGAELFSRHGPTSVGGIFVRVIQVTLVVSAGVALLVLWGYTDVVVGVAALASDQVKLFTKLVSSAVIALLGYVGSALLTDAVDDFSTETEWMTDHQKEIVHRISQLGFFAIVTLVLMSVWGVNLGGLLVGAGFLGIVIGFAARQTLGSLIAGFVLMFSRPFTIGDWVVIGDSEGIVTDITIFNTRLENFDGEFVVIPNDIVTNRAITNRSQKGLLRIRVDVGIDYDTDPDHAKQVALETLSGLTEVVDAPPPQVFPKAFGDSAVVMEMRFWIDHPTPPRKWKTISAVITSIKHRFDEESIKIPFPQQELSARAETGGFRVHDAGSDRAADAAPEPETD